MSATTVFVTGATGIIGSNIAELLGQDGHEVRALVRPGSDVKALAKLGVRLLPGDVTDADSVVAAADGAEYAIHSAAILGGAVQDRSQFAAVNVSGSAHVLDAAKKVGVRRTVYLSTVTCLDTTVTLTETSPLSTAPDLDPYSESKRATYLDVLARVGEGEDICLIASGPAYGTSPMPERSMVAPSWNQRTTAAITGELKEYVAMPLPFVFARDVARCAVSAMTRGRAGERYLGVGRPEDVMSMPAFCNLACEVAGSEHRVREISREELDSPELLARLGPSIIKLAKQHYADPLTSNAVTRERLGYDPISVAEGLALTVPWMRSTGLLAG